MRAWFLGKWLWTFDVVAGVVMSLVAAYAATKFACDPFAELMTKDGTAIYGAILSTAGALLGFAIAVITIVQGLVSARSLYTLRASADYGNFWLAFVWSIRSLGLLAILALVAIFVDHIGSVWLWVFVVVLASTIAAVIGLSRSVRTLEVLLWAVREQQSKVDDKRIETVTEF